MPFIYLRAGDRVRTGDLNLGKVALYQLSYSRKWVGSDAFCPPRPRRWLSPERTETLFVFRLEVVTAASDPLKSISYRGKMRLDPDTL